MLVLTELTMRCPSCKKGNGKVQDDLILVGPDGDWMEILFVCPECKTEARLKYELTTTTLDRTNAAAFRIDVSRFTEPTLNKKE